MSADGEGGAQQAAVVPLPGTEAPKAGVHPIEAVQKALNADILLYDGPIDRDSFYLLLDYTRESKKLPNVLLILSTLGGDPDAAYRIARCLKSRYEKLIVFVPGLCKSAGTLVALAADEVIISESGELGPLDIQVRKRDEILEFGSGLDTTKALDFLLEKSLVSFRRYMLDMCVGARISTKTAADLATQLTVGLFGKLYEQIDPVRLTETMRATTIALEYGNRLSKNLADEAMTRLVHGYPVHTFVIDLEEAKSVFRNVRAPTDVEEAMLASIPADAAQLRDPRDDGTNIVSIVPPKESNGHESKGNER
jgi:hypothetical protein